LPSEAKPRADRNQVAKRAFALFLARGASHGRDLEDWLQAERDLAAEHRGRK
jgi:hypothetical protein